MNRPDLQTNFLVVVRKVQAVVIVFGVVGLRRVDDDQAGSPDELSCVACSEESSGSSCLRFLERQLESSTPSEVARFDDQ